MSFGIPVRNGLAVGLLASTFLSSRRTAYPAMSLNFLAPFLDSRITFSRGTTATFVGSNGLIQSAAIDAPRFDYDPVTLAPKGLLIEEARTNLLLYSEQFDNAFWFKVNATATANVTLSPDGTTNADRLVENTAAATTHAFYNFNQTISAATYTLSCYLKAAGRTWSKVSLFDGTNDRGAFFDLANGVVGNLDAGVTATITPAGSGWFRCAITRTALAGTGGPGLYAASANGTINYTGDGTSGIFLYGAQLEAGSFATSYIPTVASTVTRSADVATMTGTNFSSWYNQSEGTFIVDADFNGSLAANTSPFAVSSDLNNYSNWFAITRNATTNLFSYNMLTASVAQSSFTNGSAVGNGVVARAAMAYATNDIAGSTNGAAAGTDTSATLPAVTRLLLGREVDGVGGIYLNGHIRAIAYYNTRLPNAQLQTLTAPSLATTLTMSFTDQAYTVGV